MPTITSRRHAWRVAIHCAIEPIALAAGFAMMLAGAPVFADEGDIIVQRDVTPRIAYRGVSTESLPVRTAVSPFPTQAFNQSVGSVMSVLSDGELSTSHASAANTTAGLQRVLTSQSSGVQPAAGGLAVGTAVGGAAVGGVGGQVVQATAGIASQISGALAPLSRGGQP
ncbi:MULTISPECIES: hypothetical protein [Ralstonia]|uniref:Uncharacterized protein n=1 Tax=Ralstonia insidiosa TaxID=190721 RepID=A0A848P020_9RALS|nr:MULTISPECIES: hypothetical protein [Ralstonia]ANH74216.1 hypothetical protein ACS15_0100 [Ralstonia insidiosa]EPX96335.1 LigA [Ralstonia sp. AU12-08]MBY4707598.1 hypothetical protein [Ralstonia insidiosa]NMV38877.1 hypothetical protein [Ralstonia insidiosa]